MKKLLFIFCFISIFLQGEQRATVCLNMIVRNESEVIEKCLRTVKPFIDYWVIVDTGSTDGTQNIIKNFLKDIPGVLYEKPWVNFAHNRNEALEFAKNKADYLLIIDADEVFQYKDDFKLPSLDKDVYYITVRQINAVDFNRATFISTKIPWKWEGVLHEVLLSKDAKNHGFINGLVNLCETDLPSGRSKDPNKYLNDAAILEEALKKEPENSRYVFYLAQSYYAAKNYEAALKNYEKRTQMISTDEQESYFAIYNVGKLKELKKDYDGAIKAFLKAYEFRPIRAEPIFQAAVAYRKQGNYLLGYLLSKFALTFPKPTDTCVEYMVYDYAALIEFANCALLLNRNEEGLDACIKLLGNPNLPADIRVQVQSNNEVARNRLNTKTPL